MPDRLTREASMKHLRAMIVVLTLGSISAFGQSTQSDDFKKAIDSLNDTQKAILKELQDIKSLLANPPAARPAADALPTTPMDIGTEPFKGAANAKVAVIEFSDFQCPFCGRYDKDTYPQIAKD